MVLFTNASARAGYDTRSIFKRSLTGLNSEFSSVIINGNHNNPTKAQNPLKTGKWNEQLEYKS